MSLALKQIDCDWPPTRRLLNPCRNGEVCKTPVMAQEQPTNTTALKIRHFDTDEVFLMINDPFRRAVIRALATGGMKVATDLGWAKGIQRHNKLKHLAALCKAGILVQKENPKDARQPLFGLAPSAVVCQTENVLTVEFGCCMLRFPRG